MNPHLNYILAQQRIADLQRAVENVRQPLPPTPEPTDVSMLDHPLTIRAATPHDDGALQRLARSERRPRIGGRALLAERDGVAIAAVALTSGQVATDASYAPNEFIDPGTGQIRGWDIDLGVAIGKVIGVPFVFNNADFNSIIPDIGTRYDVGISSFTPNATREKTVDFVTYYQAGESWLVKAGGPQINAPTDMCGQTIAVETGTTEAVFRAPQTDYARSLIAASEGSDLDVVAPS